MATERAKLLTGKLRVKTLLREGVDDESMVYP
jgi:hypothetical protein